jgi:hypothetical protein
VPAWRILRRLGDKRVGLAGLGFVAVMPLMVSLSARQLSDTFYAVLFLYTLDFFLTGLLDRKLPRLVLAGILAGIGFLTRSEALMWIPICCVLLTIGALGRRLTWRFALAGAAGFVVPAIILATPFVALLSKAEGRFTVRRNAGQFLAFSAGLERKNFVTTGPTRSETEMVSRHFGRVAAVWPGFFARYLYDMTSRAMGYIGAAFLVIGLIVCRRLLLRWGPLPLALLVYLLGVAQLSVFRPHSRLLVGLIVPLTWVMGAGAVAIARGIVRWNPARMAKPEKAFGWIVTGLLLTVLVPMLSHIHRGEDDDKAAPAPAQAQPLTEGGRRPLDAAITRSPAPWSGPCAT